MCYGECVGCDVEVTEYEVTFNVNMANETVAESGVYIAGGGNFGNPGDNEMTDPDGDGIYSVTVPDLTGTVEYKYAINAFGFLYGMTPPVASP